MRNLRLDLCYDGTRYRGWQRLTNSDNTIQGKLETVLSRILGETIEISGSGRTDAGVHAKGQVANFHCENPMSAEEILAQLRQYLPEDIGVLSCKECSTRFHARLNAVEKTYCYRIWNSDQPCVFERKYVWVMPQKLDLENMRRAAVLLTGTHDFLAFCSNKHFKKSSVRTIYSLQIEEVGSELRFVVTGNGFLYNMVRILVGTLLAVGRGELAPEDVLEIMERRTRERAGETVPAKGLCLMEVVYE